MLKTAKSIFFLGIKGVAMANLAVILKKMGKTVYGVDTKEKFITDGLLSSNKIKWQEDFSETALDKKIDLFVYSAAHQGKNNPLAKEALKKGIKIISQAELIGELMKSFKKKIAVCGCHGKTTTASLLSYSLIKLNQRPTYLVGTSYFNNLAGGDYQGDQYFIVEADEYGVNPPQDKTPKFLYLSPDWILATNIDFDHPDVYKDIEETKTAFLRFFKNRKLILNLDDKNIGSILHQIKAKKIITYGFSKQADYQISQTEIDQQGSRFVLSSKKNNIRSSFAISLFGSHNILNASGVIVQLLNLGFSIDQIKKAIKDFYGAKRRFELITQTKTSYLFDDYAHHPSEIKATLLAARKRFPNKKIVVIFQPHTYSRTKALINDFKKSFQLADQTYILPIFASAREKEDKNITNYHLVQGRKNLTAINSINQLENFLIKNSLENTVVFTMGAGDVYKLKNAIIKYLK